MTRIAVARRPIIGRSLMPCLWQANFCSRSEELPSVTAGNPPTHSPARRLKNAAVPVPVPTIARAVHRRADQGAGDGTYCAADDRISHVVAARGRSERCAADATDHGAPFHVGTASQAGADRKRKK